ncbi:hypothetical protein CTRI78_v009569 [Colletotrichum trifolii]|uniref:Uncharacterized protein n=1 Tax=Colletotrichum trifolii TaxID=5466 RepID=A0A4R8QQF8_COLTR|nr:hypothetical protein CTRI78_v009569 [Colletotrichum trifolii]
MSETPYSAVDETRRILDLVLGTVNLPAEAERRARSINVGLDKSTAFLIQAYLATVGGFGKLDPEVKSLLKDTDLLRAQSDPYRRMSANLYETKRPREYYHIHGSLEASTTLRMLGLEPFRPDLKDHDSIVEAIESRVRQFTVEELEAMNAAHGQAGVPALKHEAFLCTPHLARERGRGIVYVSENCFGHRGEWSARPGWQQQIADCVSGVAWEQGRFMGLDEPVVPPFPMSDYGTGCLGAVAAGTLGPEEDYLVEVP